MKLKVKHKSIIISLILLILSCDLVYIIYTMIFTTAQLSWFGIIILLFELLTIDDCIEYIKKEAYSGKATASNVKK